LPRRTRWRFELEARERQRIADLCTLLIVLAGIWLYLRQPRLGDALIVLIRWLPALVFPLLAVQLYSERRGTELSVLFLSLRGDGKPGGAETVDLRWAYLLLCAVSASMVSPQTLWFYPSLVALAVFGLWPPLPAAGETHRRRALAVLALAALLGWGLAAGLRWAHDETELLILRMVEQWMGPALDPYRSTTSIGDVGRLKGSERIRLRIYPAGTASGSSGASPPALLRTASYDRYINGTWFNSANQFEGLPPTSAGGWRRLAGAGPGTAPEQPDLTAGLRILLVLDGPDGLLPLPPDAAQVRMPPHAELQRNVLGAVRFEARGGPPLLSYRVRGVGRPPDGSPTAADLRTPPRIGAAVTAIITEAGLDGQPADVAMGRLQRLFARRFRYSLTLPDVPTGSAPIAHFLTRARYGHCEYFATAAALVLRGAGIPARYVRGWSVQEFSPLEQAWISRERHAHAWVEVWHGGGWRTFDPTPPDWGALEAADRPWHAGLGDLVARLRFVLSGAGDETRGDRTWLMVPLVLLVAVLAWRIARRGRRRQAPALPAAATSSDRKTPFSGLERALAQRGRGRRQGETLRDWAWRLRAADDPVGDALAGAVAIYYRERYDPAGIDDAARDRLSALLAECQRLDGG